MTHKHDVDFVFWLGPVAASVHAPDMAETMTEQRFEVVADATLQKMVDMLADAEDDAYDADLESGVLTIAFEVGGKFVVNSHRAARQIWMAAGATAWHFDYTDGGAWVAAKTDEELWATLSTHMSTKLGRTVRFSP